MTGNAPAILLLSARQRAALEILFRADPGARIDACGLAGAMTAAGTEVTPGAARVAADALFRRGLVLRGYPLCSEVRYRITPAGRDWLAANVPDPDISGPQDADPDTTEGN